MKAELREKILAYNRAMAERKEKAEDMDVIAAALLTLPPGQAGYALPERYKKGPDQRDYYHVGVVTAVEPLEITPVSYTHLTLPTN